jgi:PncC family amidohydrolase
MTGKLGQPPMPGWLLASPVRALWERAALLASVVSERGHTLATAESLTGGWLSAALTSVPGSSAYYMAGLVAYSNAAKESLLGVPPGILAAHGAVSPQCAEAMALGARGAAGTDLAIATTGIAGPDGGSAAKPVGLVYCAVAVRERVSYKRFLLVGDRLGVTLSAATLALDFMFETLTYLGHGDTNLV